MKKKTLIFAVAATIMLYAFSNKENNTELTVTQNSTVQTEPEEPNSHAGCEKCQKKGHDHEHGHEHGHEQKDEECSEC